MFACLYVPDFAVQASLLPELVAARDALKRSPLAILDGPANLPRVFAMNDAARRAGIQAGMTKLQVETYGGIGLRKRSLPMEAAAQATLVHYAGAFSPRVESTCDSAVILDLAGTEKLFGPPQTIARTITANALPIGFDLQVAIAANPDSAFYAARGFSGITIIPTGDEAWRLGRLPVNVLTAPSGILEILQVWGIQTLHALAALPTVAVAERLGQEGLHLQKLAQGQVNRPLLTVHSITEFTASFEFDDPVETLESLFFILNRLLQQLCSHSAAASLAAQELALTMELEVRQIQNGAEKEKYQHEWKLPVPTQDKHTLFALVRLHLERVTFSAPVRKLKLEIIPVKPRLAQGNLFAPPSPEAEKLEITLERINGVVGISDAEGRNCVGSPCLVDTHRPDSFTVQHFSGRSEAANFNSPQTANPMIALRIFRPALETSVELDGETPHFVRLWHRHRRVVAASGPWCASGDWWNASAWAREEWDVALKTPAGIGFYRIYRDPIRKQWFVEGIFD